MSTKYRATRRHAQRGIVAVEFGMLALVFFAVVFGTMEVARAMYLWGSMIEATQRAARGAANAGFDAASLTKVRDDAMFGQTGGLFLGGTLRPVHLRIDYLDAQLSVVGAASMPACPEQNIVNCSANIDGENCIRFVRARLCDALSASGSCTLVNYVPVIGGGFFPSGAIKFPAFTSITPAGLLGHQPGTPSCP